MEISAPGRIEQGIMIVAGGALLKTSLGRNLKVLQAQSTPSRGKSRGKTQSVLCWGNREQA